jgi:hypothetical protein
MQILKYMRDEGNLKDTSKGRVTVDDLILEIESARK